MSDPVAPPWRLALRNLRTRPHPASAPAVDQAAVRDLATRLEAAGMARLGGRGLFLHVLDGGDCGGCALELRMLDSVVHDLARFGLRFVDSPRQADVLLVTGPITHALRVALQQAWEAAPEPRLVVAIGDCAIDGGVFKGSYAVAGGVATTLPLDLVIRGCPPTPADVMEGLLMLLQAGR